MRSLKDVRQTFLSYFERHGHTILPSSPLVPHNDPTLMFTNAGMVQFKNIFTGTESAPNPPRATTSQKCVRAGGKHNDLDNVGYTARHHTFFEMLGNFSFGDYFKEEAIYHAWQLLSKDYALPREKLYFTVYHTDDEAFNLWKKITGCEDARILRIPTKDNFWAMGDTGPCGPCSEIFFDHGPDADDGAWALNADGSDQFGDRFIEIWNLVFMQYEQKDADTRIELPKPSIDTGMGLERMAAVMQGVHDNYDTDLFKTLIGASVELTGAKAEGEKRASHRVIADHLRSACFLIADGVLPSNEGRGYVLRRIMRRAMRHAHMLGSKQPLMYRLVPTLINEMGSAFGELERARALITETLKSEEERFQETLGRGLKLLDEERTSISAGGSLRGDVAFKLYDTYGFPLDLTQDILRSHNMTVDTDGFAACMDEQKARARAAWKGSGSEATSQIWFALRENLGATEFLGYTATSASAAVTAIIKDGAEVTSAQAGDTIQVLLNQTPCYGESGGQVGDTATISQGKTNIGQVTDTTKPLGDVHVHHITLSAPLAVGDAVEVYVDTVRRDRIRANHSATHLLHAVLRKTLGEHITQKGSLVNAERLRFDMSHPKALSAEEVATIEAEVNRLIWENSSVSTRLMNPEDAIKAGAMALFGEKYGDEVRVLAMGANHDSVELCGGTHVTRTGDIGLFKIVSEAAIAAGVRRIEAMTQAGALAFLNGQDATLKSIAGEMKVGTTEVLERVVSLQNERKTLQKELADAKKQLAMGGAGGASDAAPETIGAVQFIGKHFAEMPPKELRGLAEDFLKPLGDNGVVVVTSGFEGKGSIVVAVSAALSTSHSAVDMVKRGVEALGGQGGGGRPNMAQGGGPNGAAGDDAIAAIKASLS